MADDDSSQQPLQIVKKITDDVEAVVAPKLFIQDFPESSIANHPEGFGAASDFSVGEFSLSSVPA